MSKSKVNRGSAVEPNTQETTNASSAVEPQLEETNISSTVEPQSDSANKLYAVQANGETFDLSLNLVYKADVNQAVATKTTETVASLVSSFSGMTKGYFAMVSDMAKIIGNNLHKNIVGIKSPQQLLTDIVGTSKATASEMCTVAKRFYNADGTLKDAELGLFTYSELVKLKGVTDEVLEDVITKIRMAEKHTRADVEKAIKDSQLKAIGVENEEKQEEQNTDESTENTESTESTDTSEQSDGFQDTNGDTPFSTDWQSEYISLANKLTDIADNYKKDMDNPDLSDHELVEIALETINNIIKSMLEKITE